MPEWMGGGGCAWFIVIVTLPVAIPVITGAVVLAALLIRKRRKDQDGRDRLRL
jgi:hypothetical protein